MSENRFSALANSNEEANLEETKPKCETTRPNQDKATSPKCETTRPNHDEATGPKSETTRPNHDEATGPKCEATRAKPKAASPKLEATKPEQKLMEKIVKHAEIAGYDSDIAEDFNCAVCFRLAVKPTTLSCGHTFCRICLAQWYFSSKKKECPLCREVYQGHPKVNTQLRNLLIRLVPNEMQMREKEMSQDGKGMKVVANYDTELSKEKGYNFFTSFCSGIIVGLSTVIVMYLTWYWQTSDNELLVRKPVEIWKSKDVESWLMEMPWAQHYARLAREKEIDGKFLSSLDENSVQRLFNVTDEDELKALIFSIKFLKKQGIKMPVTIWDYKALYPGRSLFLLYSLRNFPRTSVLYMWVYFYDELFLPFVQSTTQRNSNTLEPGFIGLQGLASTPQNSTIPVPTSAMFSEFIFYIIFMPQYPIALFAWQMFQYHTFTPMFAVASAGICSFLDILSLKAFLIDREYRSIYVLLKKHVQHLVSAFIFMVLWPLIPRLVADTFFYGTLYVSPVQLSIELYYRFRQQ